MMTIIVLLVSVLPAAGEYTGSHLLHYSIMGVSHPGPGLPMFSIVQYVDDQMTTIYSSDTDKTRPGVPWMDIEDLDTWSQTLYWNQGWWKNTLKHNVKTGMSRFNQTGGLHVVQLLYGCELKEDNSTRLYFRFGYDGRDFIILETNGWVFIPSVYEAEISTNRWNTKEDGAGLRWKYILEKMCVDFLKKYFDFGKTELERKVAPEVTILAKQTRDGTDLHCWVYGFYPQKVDVRWVKNGQDEVSSDKAMVILPNPDGTYQATFTVNVQPGDGSTYSCHVGHSSLVEEIVVPWEHNMMRKWILPFVAFLLFGLVVIILCKVCKKNQGSKSPT